MVEIIELIDHFEDKRIKDKTVEEYNAYLKLMGSNIRIRMFLDSEITGIEIGQNLADRIGLGYNGVIHILETEYGDPSESAIDKLLHYSTSFRKNFEKIKENIQKINPEIKITKCIEKVIIILNPRKPLKDISVNLNCNNDKYTIKVLSPHTINGDEALKTIENKIKNNEKLTLENCEMIESAIYSKSSKEKHEILLEVSKMVENSNIKEKKKNRLNMIFKQQCIRYVKNKYRDETLEVLLMNGKGLMEEHYERIRNDAKEEGIEEGIKEGLKEGIEKSIEILKENNAPQELINKFLEKL